MAKDYYKTLGVAETASAEEIKKAYRKLAKKNHPDVTGGDKAKEAKFKEITEAYETLGDEKKRAQYDEQRKNPFAGGAGFPGGAGAPGGVDLNDLFSQFGGGRGGGRVYTYSPGGGGNPDLGGLGDIFEMFSGGGPAARERGGARQARTRTLRGEDVVARLDVDLPDAALGAEKSITVDGKSLKIKIPPGVSDGQTIRLAGQGQAGPRGGQAGDLLIELHERKNQRFRRLENPADIEVEVPVPVDVAMLGGKAPAQTLEGSTVTLSIPPGSSSGRRLRLKGKGAMQPGGKPRGDLYAVVSVQVPSELTPKQRELMEEFARLAKK
jgi:DnaJ-class molecular chaperone